MTTLCPKFNGMDIYIYIYIYIGHANSNKNYAITVYQDDKVMGGIQRQELPHSTLDSFCYWYGLPVNKICKVINWLKEFRDEILHSKLDSFCYWYGVLV